ncbi:MAG: c-type cytochrome [Zavarzinella sp.]|nr:c-type cytochrome [Zavarzinella sp.]
MTSLRRYALALTATALVVGPAAAHPIVPGFERFHTGPDANPAVGGQLLLGELNCVSCHAAEWQAKKQAPVLDAIGTRARVSHLRKFIADPQAVKPGTTMPALFAGDPDRDAKVEALVHFLATTGSPAQSRPDLKAVVRGKDTYARFGCAACHGPRDLFGEPAKNQFGFAVPLGDLKGKYTVPGLSAFLANPLQTRPSGRMPHLLKPGEALDVAQYLLQGVKVSMPRGKGTTAYAYYEGGWDRLPDLTKEKPKARGTGPAFELGLAKAKDDFAFRFDGFFRAESAGEYKFYLSSDDGSRLSIDGRKVVDNDGIHATETKSGTVELTKGVHRIAVEYFQGNGETSLEVEFEGRGLGRQPLGPHVAATEADLDRQAEPAAKKDEDALTVRPELVEKGKALFASAGCASCHQISVDKKPIASTTKAGELRAVKPAGGCLAESPAAGLPKYDLSGDQRKALAAAIAKPQAAPTEPAALIARTMLTFNCYACHSRDKVGGPTESTNPLFVTTTREMGDEARVPPPLDGVGAKLNSEYVRQILDKGTHDRPYMHTRMPGFGAANVAHLAEAFGAIDKLPAVAPVKFAEPEPKVVSAGRFMVGAQAFGCIKCHTFAGNKAEGVQGIDMTLMGKRLKRDWFHTYCVDPQKIRPGTRMPTAWPSGQSVLPNLLDGQAHTQIEAIWTYLNSKNPQVPAGMGRQFLPLVPVDGAIIYRNFIQGAGTRAIGVGYPEKLNLAFDANDLRLALVWKGGFIDAARHWTDRGAGFEGPLGDDVLALPAGAAFAVLPKPDAPWPAGNARAAGFKFLGYTTTKDDRPTFRYAFNGVTIEDFPNPSSRDNPTLRRAFVLTSDKPLDGLSFRAVTGSKIEAAGDGWFKVDGYKVRIEGAEPVVRQSAGKSELIVPIRFADGKAKFVQEIAW